MFLVVSKVGAAFSPGAEQGVAVKLVDRRSVMTETGRNQWPFTPT